jgi:hypothetical protein
MTGMLTGSVNVLLAKLKQVKTRPAKAGLVKGLKREGSIKSKVAFKGNKVRQMPSGTI